MSGYVPLFDSLTKGTLCGRWPDIGLWPIVLSLSDKHGIVDVTQSYIAGITGLPVEEVTACMQRFCAPDPYSRSAEAGGARLVLLDAHREWGWRIVNHERYREKARKAAYDAQRTASGQDAERKRVERSASRDVPTRPAMSRADPLSDSDANTNADSNKEEETDSSASPPAPKPAQVVFDHWRSTWNHPDAKLDDKRRKRIDARLKDFTPEQLCDAISGFKNSPFHAGSNADGKVFDGIQTLLRDTAQVEEGLRLYAHPPRPPPKLENLSPGERVMAAYRGNGNGSSRVVATCGPSFGDVEDVGGNVWPALPS